MTSVAAISTGTAGFDDQVNCNRFCSLPDAYEPPTPVDAAASEVVKPIV